MGKLAIALGASLLVACAQGQEIGYPRLDPESLYLKTATAVLVVGKPELVAAPHSMISRVSPDGRYVLVHSTEREVGPDTQDDGYKLRLLETRTGKLIEASDFREGYGFVGWAWSRQAGIAYLLATSYTPNLRDRHTSGDRMDTPDATIHLLKISLATGRSEEVARFPRRVEGFRHYIWLIENPVGSSPVLMVSRNSLQSPETHRSVIVLGPTGRPEREIALGRDIHVRREGWSADGKFLYLEALQIGDQPPKPDDPPRRHRGLKVDLAAGTVEWSETPLEPHVPAKKADSVRLSRVQHPVTNGTGKAQVPGMWLSAVGVSDQPPILLSSFGEDEELSPDLSSIAYTHAGAIFLRRITEMSHDEYAKALIGEEIMKRMSNAKQTALGFIMYATDHDDVLPPTQNWLAAIMPYLKNSEITDGFVFTLGGVNMTQMANIFEPPLGYVETPWGRIIVYSDTSVKFEPKPGSL